MSARRSNYSSKPENTVLPERSLLALEEPLISIGVTTYDRPDGLRRLLDCITNQTYKNLEIIVSDDCSPGEETQKVIREFSKKDTRIKAVRHDLNKGSLVNYNFVMKLATGKYFMWADDDDMWDRKFIQVLYRLLSENEGAVVAMSNYEYVSMGNTAHQQRKTRAFHSFPSHFDNKWSTFESLLNYMETGCFTIMLGLHVTEVVKRIGGYHADSRPFFHCSDYLTVLKILLNGKAVYTDKILFHKIDSGYSLRRFELLQNLKFDRKLIRGIIRFCFFPLFYFYDLIYSIRFIIPSVFSPVQKMILSVHAIRYYLRENIRFVCEVWRGVGCVLLGVFRKAQRGGSMRS